MLERYVQKKFPRQSIQADAQIETRKYGLINQLNEQKRRTRYTSIRDRAHCGRTEEEDGKRQRRLF